MVQVWQAPQEAAVAASALFELGSMDLMSPGFRMTPSLATAFALRCNRWAGTLFFILDTAACPAVGVAVEASWRTPNDFRAISRLHAHSDYPAMIQLNAPARVDPPPAPGWIYARAGASGA